jgi:hypothetical protein
MPTLLLLTCGIGQMGLHANRAQARWDINHAFGRFWNAMLWRSINIQRSRMHARLTFEFAGFSAKVPV